MIDHLTFASCYVYSPLGSDATSERSRRLCELLKSKDSRFICKYALRVRQQVMEHSALSEFIEPGDVLVPIPGSSPPHLPRGQCKLAALLGLAQRGPRAQHLAGITPDSCGAKIRHGVAGDSAIGGVSL